jgi:hypothetical protein
VKKSLYLLVLLLAALVLALSACTGPADRDADAFPGVEVVEGVPDALIHWLHSQLGLQKNPLFIHQAHEEHIYIIATLGNRSRVQGQLTLKDPAREGDKVFLDLVYLYPEEAGESLDTHFMILKAPRNMQSEINLIDGVTKNVLAKSYIRK